MADKTVLSSDSETKEDLKEPGIYQVLLHNDDYTSMEFVVDVLVEVFNKTSVEASKIMMSVHQKGVGVAGIYPYDIGISKIHEVKRRAKEESYPLLCTLERM